MNYTVSKLKYIILIILSFIHDSRQQVLLLIWAMHTYIILLPITEVGRAYRLVSMRSYLSHGDDKDQSNHQHAQLQNFIKRAFQIFGEMVQGPPQQDATLLEDLITMASSVICNLIGNYIGRYRYFSTH